MLYLKYIITVKDENNIVQQNVVTVITTQQMRKLERRNEI